MTLIHFDQAKLRQRLERIEVTRRVAFAASCAERMMRGYCRYCERTHQGSIDSFRYILDQLWSDLCGNRLTENRLNLLINACLKLIPNPDEESWGFEQAVADNAAAALVYALQCRQTGEVENAIWSALRAYEILDYLVMHHENIEIDASESEEILLSHPLIQAELDRQLRDLDELLKTNDITVIEKIRDRARSESRLFFGDLLPR